MKIQKILLVIWMVVIFCFSSQPADQSTKLSDGFINKTIIKVYKIFDSDITTEEEKVIIEKYTYTVRKLAHFSIYFILGILSYFVFKDKNNLVFTICFCIFYACTDEIHQYFVDGRYCSLFDVFIDSLGATLSIGILNVLGIVKKKKTRYNS